RGCSPVVAGRRRCGGTGSGSPISRARAPNRLVASSPVARAAGRAAPRRVRAGRARDRTTIQRAGGIGCAVVTRRTWTLVSASLRSEEHTSELQSRENLVCRLLLEKK